MSLGLRDITNQTNNFNKETTYKKLQIYENSNKENE
jgi:hypothetical protein